MPIDLEGKNPLQDTSTGTDEVGDILNYAVWAFMAGVGLLTGYGLAQYLVGVSSDLLGVDELKNRGREEAGQTGENSRGGGL